MSVNKANGRQSIRTKSRGNQLRKIATTRRNKTKRLKRHIKVHPNDLSAKKALDNI